MTDDALRTTDPTQTTGERDLDRSLRPETLDDFVGQPQLREQLRVFLDAARAREEALDHVLLVGPPGLGKTTLAGILAREIGTEFFVDPAQPKPGDAYFYLVSSVGAGGEGTLGDDSAGVPRAIDAPCN